MKKGIILLVVVVFCLNFFLLPGAANGEYSSGGFCGENYDNLSWKFDSVTGVLSIEGSGSMEYYGFQDAPWFSYAEDITTIILPDGLTSIPGYAFQNCRITSIVIPETVTSISVYAFGGCAELIYNEYGGAKYLGSYDNPYFVLMQATDLNITACDISENTKLIAGNAFGGCENLTTISIPDSVASIGEYAFRDCGNLSSVYMGSGVTYMGTDAFYCCYNLQSVHLFDIGTWCGIRFENASAVPQYFGASLYVNDAPITDLVIPDGVAAINAYAFYAVQTLNSVTISGSVKYVGMQAFASCENLATVTIANGATGIERDAFYRCYQLAYNEYDNALYLGNEGNPYYALIKAKGEKITACAIHESTVVIAARAFGNSKLKKITVPDSVVDIGPNAFGYRIEEVTLGAGTTQIGDQVFYGCSELKSIVIPATVTSIGNQAFYECESLTSISLPAGLTAIGDQAFYDCWRWKNVELPDGLLSIGREAFSGCSEMEDLSIPNTVTSIGERAFANCYNIKSVTVPSSVAVISTGMFAGCGGLAEVIISEGITSIEDDAFFGCYSLVNISIPDSVTSIAQGVFYDCYKLAYNCFDAAYYLGNENNPYLVLMKAKDTGITSCEIHQDTKIIYCEAFMNCDKLISVSVPDGVTDVQERVFAYCRNLTEITLPDSVTSLGNGVFCYCESLKHVTVPKDVSVLINVFEGCAALESVVLPENLTVLGQNLFYSCTSLAEVVIPASVKEIGNYAFYNCTGLTSIVIPEGVETIAYGAFVSCANLTVVTLPASITTIEADAFYYCDNLWHVLYRGTAEQWDDMIIWKTGNDTFLNAVRHDNCTGEEVIDAVNKMCPMCGGPCEHIWDDGVVTIPPECEYTGEILYTCISCGETYTERIPAIGHSYGEWEIITPPTQTEEGYEIRTCYTCGATEGRNIPVLEAEKYAKGTLVFCTDGVAYLYGADGVVEETFTGWMTESYYYEIINGSMVFNTPWADSTWKITAVVFEAGVAPENTDYWFMYCTQLVSVTIADGLTTIGKDMFFGCSQLTGITIPASVTSLGSFAFSDCENLSKILFQGDAPDIGEYAFHRMTATAYYPAWNTTWTADRRQSYQGNITWVGYWTEDVGVDVPRCPDGHICMEIVTEPTCTEAGYTTYFCDVCDDSYVDNYVDALNHAMDHWFMTKGPTCMEEGEECRVCIRCGHQEYRAVEKLEHMYRIEVIDPTCTEGGYNSHICVNCGATYTTDHVEALGHNWDEGVVTKEPTVESEGEKTYTCYRCGETHTESIPKKEPVIYDTPEDDTVTIPDNDCFEGGTTVIVEVIEEGELFEQITEVMENVAESYVAYEFTAIKDDVAVQPNGKLTVTFTIPEGYSTNITIYYMTEDGKLEKLDVLVDPETRVITVELECLGMYILVDQDTAPDVLLGDANGDGRVNARDARLLLRYAAGLADEDEIDLAAADYNGDGRVNARDARGVLRYAAGLEG